MVLSSHSPGCYNLYLKLQQSTGFGCLSFSRVLQLLLGVFYYSWFWLPLILQGVTMDIGA